jgi:4-hydroxy-2-oxoheptanedioate aldolase
MPSVIALPFRTAGTAGVFAVVLFLAGACTDAPPSTQETSQVDQNDVVQLLKDGQAVFGVFSGDKTAEQGAKVVENRDTDFVFYSLEAGPFDISTMEIYMQAMVDAAGEGAHPIVLRIPPMRDDEELAQTHIVSGLDAGVDGLVFPHVETADEAALAVRSMGDELWPENPEGRLINILLIEDKIGVQNARAIVGTPGVSVVIPGPGDLRRAYEGDDAAIEEAIQTVLRACQEFDVPCGITAGADDIAERLAQGFRLIIVNGDDALPVGKMAAGRSD